MQIIIYLGCAGKTKPKAANMNKRTKRIDDVNPFVAWAEARTGLSASSRLVLMALAKASDRKGNAVFSLRGLAEASGVPHHRVRKAIDDLLAASILSLRMQGYADSRGSISGFAFRLARTSHDLRASIAEGYWLTRGQANVEYKPDPPSHAAVR